MKIVRWAAAAVTVLMSLLDLPVAFAAAEENIPVAIAWAISLLGAAGLAAAIGLVLRTDWGRPAVLVVGAVNAVGAVIALVRSQEGAPIGLVLSALILVLGFLATDTDTSRLRASSPSLG
jgi:hypothetical protein